MTSEQLSAAGQKRRQHMLEVLDQAMHRRNQRRIVVRAAVASTPIVALVLLLMPRHAPLPSPSHPRVSPAASLISVIETDPGIADRLATPSASLVTIVNDAELRVLLAASGRESGFARAGSHFILAQDVDTLGQQPSESPPVDANTDQGRRGL